MNLERSWFDKLTTNGLPSVTVRPELSKPVLSSSKGVNGHSVTDS
jgi:hypothetical protein